MQDTDLRHDESTTDEERLSSTTGEVNPNVFFKVEGRESASVSEASVQELVQFLNKQSASMSKEIDSVLSSTEDSDEDSLKQASIGSGQRSAEASSLVASSLTRPADPRAEIKKLNDKVKLLLNDRKAQKERIDAQKNEIEQLKQANTTSQEQLNFLRGTATSTQQETLDRLALQGQVEELKLALAVRDRSIQSLETRVQGLVRQNEEQTKTIDLQNQRIGRLSSSSSTVTPKSENEVATFESEFAALDAALGQIDSTAKKGSPLTPEQQQLVELRETLARRDREIADLNTSVKRLESLAFDRSRGGSTSSEVAEDPKMVAQVRFLRETNEEQQQTIQLQKSTIKSLKEEVELLTRRMSEFQNDNQVNLDKQSKVSQQNRSEIEKLAREKATVQEQSDKLARDKAEFAKHLAAFKELRREVLKGAVVSSGPGVPKARYVALRHKHDKYKRKDYRKNKDINQMQKRLLQNVDLLEVEDSQSSSGTEGNESAQSSQASRSVQLVHDSSSEVDE